MQLRLTLAKAVAESVRRRDEEDSIGRGAVLVDPVAGVLPFQAPGLQFGKGRLDVIHFKKTAFLRRVTPNFCEPDLDVVAAEHHSLDRRITARGDAESHARFVKRNRGVDIADRRSKHLSEFGGDRFDYVISLCDRVREVCPEFAGGPEAIHWSIPDPAQGDGALAAFERTAAELHTRIGFLIDAIEVNEHA